MSWISTNIGSQIIELPCPAFGSGGVTVTTAINGGTNANGKFIGTVIGGDKLQIAMSYPYLTNEEFTEFLKLFSCSGESEVRNEDKNGMAHRFYVYDPRVGDYRELEMYIGDRGGTPFGLDEKGKPTGWVNVSATLTEL